MTDTTLIFRLTRAIGIMQGLCGNEPDKRDPAMVREWNECNEFRLQGMDWLRSTDDQEWTLPCEECGEDVPTTEHCGNERPDGTSEYLCPDCYEPDTDTTTD